MTPDMPSRLARGSRAAPGPGSGRRGGPARISGKVTQDGLVLAGESDSYVPYDQLFMQLPLLVNARSVTSRSFTDREHKAAAAHCNVGNGVMSLKVIVDWLDQCQELDSL